MKNSLTKALTNLFKPKKITTEQIVREIITDNILFIGFYDRANVGDEAFKNAFTTLFSSSANIKFVCIDDIEYISADVTAVVVGGGDICNEYFMNKIKKLLETYNGPCYGFSIGIPFESCVHLLEIFDHVVLRTYQDLELVANTIGNKNVTYLPDATWLLKPQTIVPAKTNLTLNPKSLKIALCLAQPAFANNACENLLLDGFTRLLRLLTHEYKGCQIKLVPFNTSENDKECDYKIHSKLMEKVKDLSNVENITDPLYKNPIEMLKYIGTFNLVIGMRFHSIVFSAIQNTPFVSIYTTRKINNLMKDLNTRSYGYKMPLDASFKPINIDIDEIMTMINDRMSSTMMEKIVNPNDFELLKTIVKTQKRKQYLERIIFNHSFETVLDNCKKNVTDYLNISVETYDEWLEGKIKTSELIQTSNKCSMDFARMICFSVTNKIGTSYLWGLNTNMLTPDFQPYDAIKWIYYDYIANVEKANSVQEYYPIVNPRKDVIIDLNYMIQDNYQGLHRSGWSYVIGGLQHLETLNTHKPSQLMVDTCLERTFLWGLDVTKASKVVPYKKPWTGFVHHTFNSTYSKHNCDVLINTPEFIESLLYCKCIFTLSEYLAQQMRQALREKGVVSVPVLTLTHPTEIVSNNFEMEHFIKNQQRKVINIGAWYRNPWAIYELPIYSDNHLKIQKCALKGKEMDNYFRPPWLFEKMFSILKEYNLIYNEHEHLISRCENDSTNNTLCRPPIVNKYLEGMLDSLYKSDKSVEVLEFLSDKEYDSLLSENLVFLNLVDCSAVNTIIECIVRNTPVIVNRHPALEEVLGTEYPGFYNNLYEAASYITDLNKINAIYEYMKDLDKEIFTLDFFLAEFQQKLLKLL